MTTITQMERTATGWKCPRCGDTREDDLLPVRAVECNCAGLDAWRYGPIVTLTAEQLRERYPSKPRKDWVSEDTAKAAERERLEALAAMTPQALAADVGVPPNSAMEAIHAARRELESMTGIPDRLRYKTVDEEEFHERGPDGCIVKVRRRVTR